MKVVKRDKSWQAVFSDANGRRVRVSTGVKIDGTLPDKGKALAMLAAVDKMREHLIDESPEVRHSAGKQLTLGHALSTTLREHWSTQKSRTEKRWTINKLIKEIGYWPLHTITYTKLRNFGKELEAAGASPATRNRKMSYIQTAMKDAKRRGEIDALPEFPHWAENNIKERYVTPDEERRLIQTMADRAAPIDHEAHYLIHLTLFLLDTGLRVGEVVVDQGQDLGDRIWLRHGSTKSGKGRTVPLTKRARAALDEMLASPYHAELRKLQAQDKDLPSARLGRRFRAACIAAGIEGVTLHTLRHTCASRLVQAGVSLYIVKEWLGHSSVTVTERYAHLAPKCFDQAAAALECGRIDVPKGTDS